MARFSWLQGLRRSPNREMSKWGGVGRRCRRKPALTTLVAVEVLEVRQVMTVTSPISLATATTNATSAQTALDSARTNFSTTMTTLENTLNGDFTAHQTTADGLVSGAEGSFDSNVGLINDGLNLTVSGLTTTFNGLVDGHETTLDGDITTAQGVLDAALAGPQATFDGAVAAAQSFFDGQATLANGILDGVINGLRTSLDGTVTSQQVTSQGNIAGFNNAFDFFADGQQTWYDGQELGFWNTYLTATGSSATGLQGIYNTNMATAATTRDSILSSYPGVVYNPDILVGTSAYDALVSGANTGLYNSLTLARNNFNSDVQTDEDGFQNAVYGPGGAMPVYMGAIDNAQIELQGKIDTANSNYHGIVDPALSSYQNTVYGPAGLVETYEDNVAGFQANYYGAVQTAQGFWQGAVDTAQGIYDGAVAAAQQHYQNWQWGQNQIGGTQTTTTTITHAVPVVIGPPEIWTGNGTVIDKNGHASSTTLTTTKPWIPTGSLTSSTTSTTVIGGVNYNMFVDTYQENLTGNNPGIGNAFDVAMDNLTDWTEQIIAGLALALDDTITGLQTTLQGQITAANGIYDNQMNNATTGSATLFANAVMGAGGVMNGNANTFYNNYQATLSSLMMPMMMAMMSGLPPNMTPMYQATQDYALNVIGEEISYTDTVGNAFVSYVTQERAADTFRDQTIVNAIDGYLQQAINAVDAFQGDALAEFKDWLDGMTDLESARDTQDAVELTDWQNGVNDAAQTFGLAEDTADEQFAISESNAALACAQNVVSEVETFRNSEMGARVGFLQTEAPAAKAFDTEVAKALGDSSGWLVDGANAQNACTITTSNAGESLQNNLLGDQTSYTNAIALVVQGCVTSVSNGIAAQWAAAMGGGPYVTAVANAWAAFDQAAALQWANLINGEATFFQNYGGSEAGAAKTVTQNDSAQNVPRVTSIGGELVAYDGVVGGLLLAARQSASGALTPWMSSIASAERSASNQGSGGRNTFELVAAPLVHTANDADVNAIHAFFSNVTSDWTPYAQNVIAQDQTAQHGRIGQFNMLLTSTRTARTAEAQSDRGSWTTFALTAAGAEDNLVATAAQKQKADAVLGAVTRFTNTAAQSPTNFTGGFGQSQITRPPIEGMFLATTGMGMNDTKAIAIAGVAAAQTAAKPQVTVGLHGQIISTDLSWWQRSQLQLSQIIHPSYSGREAAIAAGFTIRQTGQSFPTIVPIAQPTGLKAFVPVIGPAQNAGYHFQQGNYATAAFYEVVMVGDMFMVRSVVQGGGKLILRGGQRLLAEEAGGLMIPRLGQSTAQAGGELVHLTNSAAGQLIDESGVLIGNIYAGPIANASALGLEVALRTGLSPATYEVAFQIPAAGQAAFSRVIPIGPVTLWQFLTRQEYTARGILTLRTGDFIRQGVNTNQLTWYAIDAGIVGGVGVLLLAD